MTLLMGKNPTVHAINPSEVHIKIYKHTIFRVSEIIDGTFISETIAPF